MRVGVNVYVFDSETLQFAKRLPVNVYRLGVYFDLTETVVPFVFGRFQIYLTVNILDYLNLLRTSRLDIFRKQQSPGSLIKSSTRFVHRVHRHCPLRSF